MRSVLSVAVAIVCLGCEADLEPTKVPPEEYPDAGGAGGTGGDPIIRGVSGSRLRAVYKLGGDGSREFVTWYDLERDEDCAFTEVRTTPLSTRRCLPMSGDLVVDDSGGYVDAQCARRGDQKPESAPLSRKGKPLKTYRLYAEQVDNEIHARVFVHGAACVEASEAQPATLQLYRKTDDGCEPESPMEVTRTWVYLDEISLDDFVFWTEAVE